MCGRVRGVCGVGIPASLHTILEQRVENSCHHNDHESMIEGPEVRIITRQRSAIIGLDDNKQLLL